MLPQRINDSADKITKEWGKNLAAILKTALACAEAALAFDAKEQKLLLRALGTKLSQSTYSKLTSVGKSSWLQDPNLRDLLPARLEHLYELSRLSDVQREALMLSKKLTPAISRAELMVLRAGRRADVSDGGPWTFAWVRASHDFADGATLAADLKSLLAKYSCELKLGEHPVSKAQRIASGKKLKAGRTPAQPAASVAASQNALDREVAN